MIRTMFRWTAVVALFFAVLGAEDMQENRIDTVIKGAYSMYKDYSLGQNANYIQALAEVDSAIFGIAIVDVNGSIYEAGDSNKSVSIQSISKVFTAALLMEEKGSGFVKERIGVRASAFPFDSILSLELRKGALNPMVNAGALQAVSLLDANGSEYRWSKIKQNIDRFAGEELPFNQKVYESEMGSNAKNRAISELLRSQNLLGADAQETLEVYTKQCSINASARSLAVMAATLANGGVNPVTNDKVIDAANTPKILSIMQSAGLYDNSGAWSYDTGGVPSKSGVGGGFIIVIPGSYGIGIVSPPLDEYGNSVRAQRAALYIIEALDLGLLSGVSQ